MKAIIWMLLICFSTTAFGDDWQTLLANYLQGVQQNASDLTLLAEQKDIATAILSLPDDQYKTAVLQLGDDWKTNQQAIAPIIQNLFTQWQLKCFDPVQMQSNEQTMQDTADLLRVAATLSMLTYLSSMVRPSALPILIRVGATGAGLLVATTATASTDVTTQKPVSTPMPHPVSACPDSPYTILYGLAAPQADVDAAMAQQLTEESAEIARLGVSTAGSVFFTVANAMADGAAFTDMIGVYVKQVLLVAILADGAYEITKYASTAIRDGDVDGAWNQASNQLQQAFQGNQPGTDAAADAYYQSTQQTAAFYSATVTAAQATFQSTPSSQAAINALRAAYLGDCSDWVDERYLIRALKKGQTADANAILQTGKFTLNMAFTKWLYQWTGKTIGHDDFANLDDFQKTRTEFMTSANAKKIAQLNALETAMKKMPACQDGIAVLLNADDTLTSLKKQDPQTFAAHPGLVDVQQRLQAQTLSTYAARHAFLAAEPAAIPLCVVVPSPSYFTLPKHICRTSDGVLHQF